MLGNSLLPQGSFILTLDRLCEWMSHVFASFRYQPLWKHRAEAHWTHEPHLWAAFKVDGKLAGEESDDRRHWENSKDMPVKWATPEAAQPLEDKKWRPGHTQGPAARPKALEDVPLPQDCHAESEEDHPVPSQLHHVQVISEAIFRNDRKSGPFIKDKLLITRDGHGAVSSPWTRSNEWVDCFSAAWGGNNDFFLITKD